MGLLTNSGLFALGASGLRGAREATFALDAKGALLESLDLVDKETGLAFETFGTDGTEGTCLNA